MYTTHWAWLRLTRHGSARSVPHRRRATWCCSPWATPRSHAESPGHRRRPPQHSWATRTRHTQSVHGAFPTGRQLIALHSSPVHSIQSLRKVRCIHSYHGALDRDNRPTIERATNPPRMSSAVSPATNQARCSHGVRRAWYKTSRVHDWFCPSTCSGHLGQLRQPTVAQVLQRLWHPASATRPLSACATAMGGPWRWEGALGT